MPKYRFAGSAPVFVPDLNRELHPGDEFESELAFSPAIVEVVDEIHSHDSALTEVFDPEPEEAA